MLFSNGHNSVQNYLGCNQYTGCADQEQLSPQVKMAEDKKELKLISLEEVRFRIDWGLSSSIARVFPPSRRLG